MDKTKRELPEGDAPSEFAEILMGLAADCSCMGDGIVRHFEPKDVQNDVDALMRVVERDYVYREVFDVMCDECQRLEGERDEWKAKAEQAAMEAQRGSNGTCPDADETCPIHSKAQSKTEPKLSELFGILSDESCRQYADQGEHPETHDRESDSREKLEADVRRLLYDVWTEGWELGSRDAAGGKDRMCDALALLDRQAAITEREYRERAEKVWCDCDCCGWSERVVELQANLNRANDDFESARVELQEKVDEQRESLEAAWEDNAELIIKVDALMQANGDLREEWHRVCRERDELRRELTKSNRERDDLQRELHASNRERERLREQLGIAIDHAHDMIALVSLDGDAE